MLRKRRMKAKGVVQVTFSLPGEAGGDVVHLVGDFTDWQGRPMEQRDDGTWKTTVELEPGRSYQFRYLVDGDRWENDWEADDYVAGPFGEDNSVVQTPELPAEAGGARSTKPTKKATAKKSTKKATAKKSTAKKARAKKPKAKKATPKSTAKTSGGRKSPKP